MRMGSLSRLLLTLALDALLGSASEGRAPSGPSNAAPRTASRPLANLSDSCEPMTINYITHTLPQQCHKSRSHWAIPTSTTDVQITEPAPPTSTSTVPLPDQSWKPRGHDDDHDLATSTFMSFEEWKEMMLQKQDQDPPNSAVRKRHAARGESYGAANNEVDSLGDDGEIALDFDALSDKVSEYTTHTQGSNQEQPKEDKNEPVLYNDGNTRYYRSKDAGKTCKERFSYVSFDAGATVLKASKGAKNTKAILIENKDSYMLLECATPNKFVIIEMSDDILVDTVVLANYEFFSSMIRRFRVSVSDHYPVKSDKWKVLGTFEARNSRDTQAFLIEHPHIFAKYIRIEFLTHYGNEYYCPVSLVRVHGTRMLDTLKESEPGTQDDEPDEVETIVEEIEPPLETAPEVSPIQDQSEAICPSADGDISLLQMFQQIEDENRCPAASPTVASEIPSTAAENEVSAAVISPSDSAPQPNAQAGSAPDSDTSEGGSSARTASPSAASSSSIDPASSSPNLGGSSPGAESQSSPGSSSTVAAIPKSPISKPAPNSSTVGPTPTVSRNKTATSIGPASPTIQESFFKTVSKRLAMLETNTSLSLQYIQSQSRFLQQTLQTIERKQLARVDSFLDQLNATVLSDLHQLRQQYDQIWQSTVIALETQREQNARENVALSRRLELLADEVVFQKRMAIAQSVLLLACLVLVIFSRTGTGSGAVNSVIEYPRSAGWKWNIASPSHSSLRGPETVDSYGGQTLTPLRGSFLQSRISTGMDQSKSPPCTPASGDEEDDPNTPTLAPVPHPSVPSMDRGITNSSEDSVLINATDGGLNAELGSNCFDNEHQSRRNVTELSEEPHLVFDRGSTESSMESESRESAISVPVLELLNGTIKPPLHSRRASTASSVSIKPMPSVPEDPS